MGWVLQQKWTGGFLVKASLRLLLAHPFWTQFNPDADLDFAYDAETLAASEDEREHQVTVPESIKA